MNDDLDSRLGRRRFLAATAAFAALGANRGATATSTTAAGTPPAGAKTAGITTAGNTATAAGGPPRPLPESATKTICVLGASGAVGNAITRELLTAGHRVIAVSRSADKLGSIRAAYGTTKRIETQEGDVSSDSLAAVLRDAIVTRFGMPDGVVASLGAREVDLPMRILSTPTETLRKAFEANFFTHVAAARALVPALAPRGVYVGINGGMADLVVPNRGQLSMTQSALRTLYSVLAMEARDSQAKNPDVRVHVLGLYGLIIPYAKYDTHPDDRWISDRQVGERVNQIVTQPQAFPDPAVALKAKAYS